MCTVSAIHSAGSIRLLFNRDEQRQRPAALPPELHRASSGCRFLAPTDPQGGGTWLALNERGIAVGLLNHYPDSQESPILPHPEVRQSRGLLVTTLAALPSLDAMRDLLNGTDLAPFPPFHGFALNARGVGWICHWNGDQTRLESIEGLPWFFTTSSYQPQAVRAWRHRQFASQDQTPASQQTLHWDPGSAPDPYALRMERDDARTVSISSLQWNRSRGEFHYVPITGEGTPGPERHLSLNIQAPAQPLP